VKTEKQKAKVKKAQGEGGFALRLAPFGLFDY
jgi:hypothetical protein